LLRRHLPRAQPLQPSHSSCSKIMLKNCFRWVIVCVHSMDSNRMFLNFDFFGSFLRALNCYSAICGCSARSKTDRHKECSRAGEPPVDSRDYKARNLSFNCKFQMIIKPCWYKPKVTPKSDGTTNQEDCLASMG
jgi:hypothetical protein